MPVLVVKDKSDGCYIVKFNDGQEADVSRALMRFAQDDRLAFSWRDWSDALNKVEQYVKQRDGEDAFY